jgi:UDP-glucose 4-epimerase
MRALITGGCGFIGSNLAHALFKKKWSIDIVDDLSSGNPFFLEGLPTRFIPNINMAHNTLDESGNTVNVFTTDFANSEILSRVREGKYGLIFHLAANPRVEYSVNNPTETTETNILKSIGLFECAIKGGVTRVIFSSTCAVYGDAAKIPTSESCIISPNSPYGLQKHTVENFARLLNKTHNFESVCLRYFNVYGPRQFGDSPYATAIAAWTHSVYTDQQLRSDGDGTQTRDLVFVDDIVTANILAATSKNNFCGKSFNIATGKSVSNLDILEIFREKFSKITVKSAPWRAGDVMHTLAETSLATKILRFSARTSLREGLKITWTWWESARNNNAI